MFSKYLAFLYISLLMAGCASAPVYEVIPVAEDSKEHMSRTIISAEDDSAKTLLNFDAQAGNYFSFFVVVENKSTSPVTVSPEDFYAEEYFNDNPEQTPTILYALSPDNQVENIDKASEELESQNKINNGLNCFLLGAVVVSDIADIGTNKSEEEREASAEAKADLLDKIENDNYEYENSKYELEMDRDYWQYEVLRSTTLHPGDKIGGIFYLPIHHKAKSFKVIIPVADTEYMYTYRQRRSN